jgi:branched-chain amino acid aminotransferase
MVVDDPKTYAFFEGNFVPLEDAKVSIMTHAFMYGTAIFEGIRGYWNEKQEQMYLFRMREHLDRMWDSMKVMKLERKYSMEEFEEIIVELVRRNKPKRDIYIRASAYKSDLKIGVTLEDLATQMAVLTVPFGSYYHGSNELKVVVSGWRRIAENAIPNRAKIVGAYANTALAKADAVAAGFDDCIVLSDQGRVSEGSAMNIFLLKHGQLITPSLAENILEGITRATIIEMAEAEFNIKTICRPVDRSELYTADELFFTGTAAKVAPIIEVDKRPISTGKAGQVSTMILKCYTAICRGEVPAYKRWLTPVFKQAKSKDAETKVKTKS